MDEDQYRKRMDELFKNALADKLRGQHNSNDLSTEQLRIIARVEGIQMCFQASVKIGAGTGESAAQTMARAKDLFRAAESWALEPTKKVRK